MLALKRREDIFVLPRKFDTTIAHKMLNLMPELSGTDKRVAATIIDHFNRKTGQCDPSIERIARLLGLSRRTVIRSNARVVKTGVLRKVLHGGHLQRNSYEPVWSRFREFDAAWSVRFKTKTYNTDGSKLSPAPGQESHIPGVESGTQTLPTNQFNKTRSDDPANSTLSSGNNPVDDKGQPKRKEWNSAPEVIQADLQRRAIRRAEAARSAAERRWGAALHNCFSKSPDLYAKIIGAIDGAMQNAATDAEMKEHGAGFACILERLNIQGTENVLGTLTTELKPLKDEWKP